MIHSVHRIYVVVNTCSLSEGEYFHAFFPIWLLHSYKICLQSIEGLFPLIFKSYLSWQAPVFTLFLNYFFKLCSTIARKYVYKFSKGCALLFPSYKIFLVEEGYDFVQSNLTMIFKIFQKND